MVSLAGRRRVAFQAPIQSRHDRLASSNASHSRDYSSDEDEDEEERLSREEEEEERRLSAANGEASEAPSSNKRKQTDQEIADLYASTAKKRKPRVTLQPTHLTGVEGLIRIRSDFPSLKYREKRSSVDSAAAYSRSLIHAFKGWAINLFPGLAFDDVLSRVETFGSKREVKSYLAHMRADVRNAHLEKIFGKERAERMLNELEKGLEQQQLQRTMAQDDVQPDASSNVNDTSVVQTTAPTAEDRPKSPRASFMAGTSQIPNNLGDAAGQPSVTKAAANNESDSEEELEFEKRTATEAEPSAFCDTDEEEDEEKSNEIHSETGVGVMVPQTAVDATDDEIVGGLDNSHNGNEADPSASPGAQDVDEEDQISAKGSSEQFNANDGCDDALNSSQLESTDKALDTQLESQTQATVIATQFTSSGESQTQATVCASQIGPLFDTQSENPTQDTVLATQLSLTQM